ncbi:MAG TPA: FecR family protein [Candidatus Obscuribacterales bacterium]
MKKLLVLAISTLMLGLTSSPGITASSAKVAYVFNQVQVSRGGRWLSAANGTAVNSGAYVRTGSNSRAQIHYSDGSVMRLGSRSIARIREVGAKNVQLNRGRAYFKVAPQQQKMRVRTRTAVATVLGTEFVVEVKESGAQTGQLGPQAHQIGGAAPAQLADVDMTVTQITTLDGLVGVSDANGQNGIELPEGMTTFIGTGGAPRTPEEIDLENFEDSQSDLGLDDDNDVANGDLDPSNPLARNTINQNSPGEQGSLGTSPTTGNLELIIH